MRKLYNIRGYNGSGKSTIPHELIREYGGEEICKDGRVVGMKIKSLNLIIVGPYHVQCGGTDCIKSKKEIVMILNWMINSFNEDILIEGIFISTSEKYYIQLFKYLRRKYRLEPIIIFMDTSPKLCLYNIEQRRNGKIKFDKGTYTHILKGYSVFKKFFKCFIIHNDFSTKKKELLAQFIELLKQDKYVA